MSNNSSQPQQQQEAIEFCIGDVVSLPPATSRPNNTYATTTYTGTIGKIVGPVCTDPCDPQQTPICLIKVLGEANHSPLVFAVNELQPLTEAKAFQELLKSWGYRDITALINRVEDQLHQQYQTERKEYYCVLQTPEGGPAYCVSRYRLFVELDNARRRGQRYEQCPAPDPEQNLWMVVGNFAVEEKEDDDEDVLLPPPVSLGVPPASVAEQIISGEDEEENNPMERELALKEVDILRGQERDIMQARYQALIGAITLVSVFSLFLSAPAGIAAYALAICPLLIACIARYVGAGEASLRIIRMYLRQIEKRYGYSGYEQFYNSLEVKQHGGGVKGLRASLLLIEALASSFVAFHLWADHDHLPPVVMILLCTVVALCEVAAMVKTWQWLQPAPKPAFKQLAVKNTERNEQ